MWVDQEGVRYCEDAVRQNKSVMLQGLDFSPERFINLSGTNQTNLVIAETDRETYVVMVPNDLTPRSADIAPYFQNTQEYQGYRMLNTPVCSTVESALHQAGVVLGRTPPGELAARPADGVVRVSSGEKEGDQDRSDDASAVSFIRDLTEEARQGRLAEVHGREKEVEQVVTIMLQKDRHCPLLVGEPGTGKTAIVEKLAMLSARDELPKRLRGISILALDLPELVAASPYKGDMEKNVGSLMDRLEKNPSLVLFADEVHALAFAHGDLSVLEMMKPKLARGLRVVAATTHAEYKQRIASDEALVRRFDLVNINEPGTDETEQILTARLPKLGEHHGVDVPQELLEQIVFLADEYFPDLRRPDKALKLLDRCMAAEALKAERGAQ